jgi:uncharacterized protein YggE
MNRVMTHITLATIVLAAFPNATLRAQEVPTAFANEGIIGAGTATVDADPQVLRLQMSLSAEAKDAKAAIAALKQAEQSAAQKLAKIGAPEGAVKFTDLQVNDGSRTQQMQRQMGMRFGQPQTKKPQQAPVVTATATLIAEFPLKNRPGEDLMMEFQGIRQQVKSANLNDVKPTAEQQEEAEEQQAMAAQMMAQGEGGNPGEPSYVFVTKVSEADRDKALADAFGRARKEAERLAKAAGLQLGALKLLSSATGAELSDRFNNYAGFAYRQAMAARGGMANSDSEAVSDQPGKVSYRARVQVAYSVKGQ